MPHSIKCSCVPPIPRNSRCRDDPFPPLFRVELLLPLFALFDLCANFYGKPLHKIFSDKPEDHEKDQSGKDVDEGAEVLWRAVPVATRMARAVERKALRRTVKKCNPKTCFDKN